MDPVDLALDVLFTRGVDLVLRLKARQIVVHHLNGVHLKNEKSDARFRNEHVTLKEIIAANI